MMRGLNSDGLANSTLGQSRLKTRLFPEALFSPLCKNTTLLSDFPCCG
jgi:hypothetical protein